MGRCHGHGGGVQVVQPEGVGDGQAEGQHAHDERRSEGGIGGSGSLRVTAVPPGLHPVVEEVVAFGVRAAGAVESDSACVHGLRCPRVGAGCAVADGHGGRVGVKCTKGIGDSQGEGQYARQDGGGEGRTGGGGVAEGDGGAISLHPVIEEGVAFGVRAAGAVEGDGAGVHSLRCPASAMGGLLTTVTVVVSRCPASKVSVTVRLKVSTPSMRGAVKVGRRRVRLLRVTMAPPVCTQ